MSATPGDAARRVKRWPHLCPLAAVVPTGREWGLRTPACALRTHRACERASRSSPAGLFDGLDHRAQEIVLGLRSLHLVFFVSVLCFVVVFVWGLVLPVCSKVVWCSWCSAVFSVCSAVVLLVAFESWLVFSWRLGCHVHCVRSVLLDVFLGCGPFFSSVHTRHQDAGVRHVLILQGWRAFQGLLAHLLQGKHLVQQGLRTLPNADRQVDGNLVLQVDL